MTGTAVRGMFAVLVAATWLLVSPPVAARGDSPQAPVPPPRAAVSQAEINAVIKQAFLAVYSLDEPEALALARRSVAMGPDEPAAHRTLASVLWLAILFRRGAVISDSYLSGSLKDQVDLPKPPPDLDAEFKRELAAAIGLGEARMRRDPRDLQARSEAGTAYALQASYTATVEGRVLGAMRLAKRAFDAKEYALAREPQRIEAGLVAGTYRYVIASLPLPVRMMAYIVGFGGGKERGVAMIEAATHAADTRVDAKVALILIYSRERRHADAARLARELQEEFPRNRLFVLEEGSAAARAGRWTDADAILTRGLAMHDGDNRRKIPGERAIWLYKRAAARVALRRLPDAQTDLGMALQNQPLDWTRGLIQLETGRIADLTGRRSDAVSAYRQARTLCAAHNDPVCAGEAERLLGRPFK